MNVRRVGKVLLLWNTPGVEEEVDPNENSRPKEWHTGGIRGELKEKILEMQQTGFQREEGNLSFNYSPGFPRARFPFPSNHLISVSLKFQFRWIAQLPFILLRFPETSSPNSARGKNRPVKDGHHRPMITKKN